ncbi:hypothetical protein [Ovoidimarina sediminis]|uniref:hypothetical protein n=1 Tax=Ovoidimarina sediminis TaxID=3079856 RepID=UPI0029067C3E|nr:hypothetical protein [Rhodophyticola sp. MJ-SS7]MDU8943079.1 hypothetical protein [Rhodophyticola sp. MJ-SS7]
MADFILDLTHDGIRLLSEADGMLEDLGYVALTDADLPGRMRALHATAAARVEGPVRAELIIPGSQILYTKLKDPEHGGPVTAQDIRAGLDGLTPCPVEELRFDWRIGRDGIQVAALDVNTLDEAESFAATYGFEPVRFTARPEPDAFPDIPDFGLAEFARHTEDTGTPVAAFSSSRKAAEAVPAAEIDAEPESEPERETEPEQAAGAGDAGRETEPPVLVLEQALPPEPPLSPPTETPEALARRIVRPEAPVPSVAVPAKMPRRPDVPPRPAARAEPRPRKAQNWRDTAITSAAALGVIGALVWTALALVTPDEVPVVLVPPDTPTVPAPGPGAVQAFAAAVPPPVSDQAALPRLEGPAEVPVDAMSERRTAALGTAVPPADVPVVDPYEPLRSADMWQTPPPTPPEPVGETLDQLYLAAIDPAVPLDDAIALLPAEPDWITPSPPAPPPEPGRRFDLDDRGLVRATPDGSDTPEGVMVTEGAPPLTPPARPITAVIAANEEVALALADKTPRRRPADLVEQSERTQFGGRTLSELAGLKPAPRPASVQESTVLNASLAPSAQAIGASRLPRARPNDFDAQVAQAQARAAAAAASAAVASLAEEIGETDEPAQQTASAAAVATPAPEPAPTAAPSIPTSASVARQATIPNAINLRRVNLIGVYGSATDRRALLRLPSGRYVKVKVGDKVDGGRVRAIGDGQLIYVKGGRDMTLTVPSG